MSARRFGWIGISLGLLPLVVACGGSERTDRPIGTTSPAIDAVPMGEPGYLESEGYLLVLPSEHEAVVVLDSDGDPEALALEYGLEILELIPTDDGGMLVRFGDVDSGDLQGLRHEEGVTGADPNLEVQMGEAQTLILGFLEGGWDPGIVAAQSWIEDLELPRIHETATGDGALIAILDTGAYAAHPLLDGKTISLPPGSALGSEEYMDHIDNDEDGEFDECFGHGTHVAGCIATTAPGATLLPIRVMTDDGVGSLWDILRGIDLARQAGADIINLSLSLLEENDSMEAALSLCADEGIVVFSAAGNAGNRVPRYPATSDHVIGVASVDADDYLSTFSGAGVDIAVAAPGEEILSSYPRAELWYATGTSMATPIAAGCLALVMDAGGLSASAAVTDLCAYTSAITPSQGVHHGRVSPLEAILDRP